jgi:hypothetical protein
MHKIGMNGDRNQMIKTKGESRERKNIYFFVENVLIHDTEHANVYRIYIPFFGLFIESFIIFNCTLAMW